jgi:NAD(P)-dependent dehydrogenase (short-subunit alcohol dehydrogenase family)
MGGQMSTRFATYPSLRDRVVFISGGSTGLGAEFVAQFASQGAKVAFADIDEVGAKHLIDQVTRMGLPSPSFWRADVCDVAEFTKAIRAAAERLGPIATLVNNAANDERRDSGDIDLGFWDEKVAVNLRHHFFAIQAVRTSMSGLGGGSIINLGSISAHADFVGLAPYITSKAAIEGLTRTLARELGPENIRVNCVIPGWVMTERQLSTWVSTEVRDKVSAVQSLKASIVPADVSRLVLWLAADDSAMCTGQKWVVDGGWM